MAIVRYPRLYDYSNPFQELERMRREMDRVFTGLMGEGGHRMSSGVYPAVNIYEGGESFFVEAELPGIRSEDLDIAVEGNTLTLRGQRKGDEEESVSYHRRERMPGTFHKAVTLPSDVDSEKVTAQSRNGVLRLVLPKAAHAKPRKITVKTE